MHMNPRVAMAAVVGCIAALPILAAEQGSQRVQGPKPSNGFATLSKLPSLGGYAEAHAVTEAGTVVVGQSFDRAGYLYAVKWTLQHGSWVISTLPYPGIAATARGIDNQGNAVGYYASFPHHRLLWPAAGGHRVLGCDSEQAVANGISADGQVVVGQDGPRATAGHGPGYCSETLPPLETAGSASARTVNGDGRVIGGIAFVGGIHTPARWTGGPGQWQVEQLDPRRGFVHGANRVGDLAGSVTIPCAVQDGCLRSVVWYATGGSRELGTLGGERSWARDVNAAGEVVGLSNTSPRADATAYFWSQSTGMLQLPVNRGGSANAMSDPRPDGTRLVVGSSQGNAIVWVVRIP